MKKRVIPLLTSMVLLFSMTACSSSTSSTAEAGETYTGTVIELTLEHLVLSTEDGNITIPYSEDTEFVNFSSMGGGMAGADQPGGGFGGDTSSEIDNLGEAPDASDDSAAASDQDTPPDLPDGESAEDSESEMPPREQEIRRIVKTQAAISAEKQAAMLRICSRAPLPTKMSP